jgi:hypothetical protein
VPTSSPEMLGSTADLSKPLHWLPLVSGSAALVTSLHQITLVCVCHDYLRVMFMCMYAYVRMEKLTCSAFARTRVLYTIPSSHQYTRWLRVVGSFSQLTHILIPLLLITRVKANPIVRLTSWSRDYFATQLPILAVADPKSFPFEPRRKPSLL